MKQASKLLKSPKEGVSYRSDDPKDVKVDPNETDAILQELVDQGVEIKRPRTRGECPTTRPCPFVSCRHHLYLDVMEDGEIRFNFKGLEPHELTNSCSLDISDIGPLTALGVGNTMGLTRPLVSEIEAKALAKLKEREEAIELFFKD